LAASDSASGAEWFHDKALMDAIRTMNLERVEKLRHIVPPWMLNRITGKTTMQSGLLMSLAQF
jgi:hypothetical protein